MRLRECRKRWAALAFEKKTAKARFWHKQVVQSRVKLPLHKQNFLQVWHHCSAFSQTLESNCLFILRQWCRAFLRVEVLNEFNCNALSEVLLVLLCVWVWTLPRGKNSGKAGSFSRLRGYYYIIALIIFIVFCCSIESSITSHEEHQGIFWGCVTCVFASTLCTYIYLYYIYTSGRPQRVKLCVNASPLIIFCFFDPRLPFKPTGFHNCPDEVTAALVT